MPFDNVISKVIQVRKTTDDKLLAVMKAVEDDLSIQLKSRDQAIDFLASRYLKETL